MESQSYLVEQVQVIREVDDITMLICLGHDSLYKRTRIRLHRISSGEQLRVDEREYARDYLRSLLISHKKKCTIEVRYRRGSSWIVDLFYEDENQQKHSVNEELAALGFGMEEEGESVA